MAVSFQCMTKFTTNKKNNKKKEKDWKRLENYKQSENTSHRQRGDTFNVYGWQRISIQNT